MSLLPVRIIDHANPPPGAVTVRRFDRAVAQLSPVRRASDGAVLFSGTVAREGVYPYWRWDGVTQSWKEVRVYVAPQALTDSRWIGTLGRSGVTINHPLDEQGRPRWVTPENAQELVVGDIDSDVKIIEEDVPVEAGGFVKVTRIQIQGSARDASSQAAMGDGLVELSPGYTALEIPESGEHALFGPYDAMQVARWDNNHVALCEMGRGSVTAERPEDRTAIHLDGTTRRDGVMASVIPLSTADASGAATSAPSPNEDAMTPQQIAALATLLTLSPSATADAVFEGVRGALQSRVDAGEVDGLRTQVTTLTTERDTANGERDTAKGEAKALQTRLDAIEADAKKAADAAELATLQDAAKKLKLATTETVDGKEQPLTADALRLAIAKTVDAEVTTDSSPDYLRGLLKVAMRDGAAAPTARPKAANPLNQTSTGNTDAKPANRGPGGGEGRIQYTADSNPSSAYRTNHAASDAVSQEA